MKITRTKQTYLPPWRAGRGGGLLWALGLGFGMLLASGLGAQSTDAAGNSNLPAVTPLPAPTLALPDNIQPDLVTPAASDNYIIGANDLLTVFVYQMPELTRQLRVSNRGNIRLPFVRKRFHASGKTATQLQRDIARELLTEGLAHAPMVQVVVRQVESKPIVVAGEVLHPQTLQAARPMRLLEILSRVGGLTKRAGDSVLVMHRGHSGKDSLHQYNLVQLIRYNNPADNPLLSGHDSITVMPAQLIYVVGAFQKPGAFPLRMGRPITAMKAVALAQGFSKSPDQGNARLITTLPNGKHREIRIHLHRILLHKAPDVPMLAGDILYVPHDKKRQILLSALQDAAQAAVIFAGYKL